MERQIYKELTMKKTLSILLMVISTQAFAFKVGVIDMEKFMLTIKDGQRIKTTLEKMQEEGISTLKKKEAELLKLNQSYRKQRDLLSKEGRNNKEQELALKSQELQKMQMQLERDLMTKEEEMKAPIFKRLETILKKIAKARNLDLTVTKQQNPFVTIKDEVDISNEAITRYETKK